MARSTFSGLNAATSGLFAAQRVLDTIGHNIANQNTPGYTRQRANQSAASATAIENGNYLGMGVKMSSISQIRDELLDIKYRNENTKKGYWSQNNVSFSQIENIFGEPKGNGIAKALNEFFTSIDSVLKNPDDPTAKQTFIETGLTFTRFVNNVIGKFETLISDADHDVNSLVTDINSKTKQIAELNKSILEAETQGGSANDLRDKRNTLIDELSEMADIRVNKSITTNNSGQKIEKYQIEIGDHVVVDHDKSVEIKKAERQDHPLYAASQKYNNPASDDLKNVKVTNLYFADGQQLNMNNIGGKLGATLQQRDSYGDPAMGNDVRGIPYYVRAVNEFVKSFAAKANDIHQKGTDKNGDKGLPLFTISGNSRQIDARNVTINPDIVNSVSKLAIGISGNQSDNKNFQELYSMRNKELKLEINQNIQGHFKTLDLGKGKPEDVIKSLITSVLGVDAKEAKDNYKNQVTLSLEADMSRMEVSSVSENEELTNMVKFQHAYNASARMITTVDEMIDVLINRMGRVGL